MREELKDGYERYISETLKSQEDAFKAISTLFKTRDIVSLVYHRETVNGTGYFNAVYKKSKEETNNG